MGLFGILKARLRRIRPSVPTWSLPEPVWERPLPREMRFPVARPDNPLPPEPTISGRCWVIDGDTIVIDRVHIRLAGIDAPELDHPYGQQSKWAMVALCKGQTVTAHIKPELSYERLVAQCFLPDGRDLAAELVKLGLALDWPKFSGGKYRALETPEARKKLWRANLRQGGLMRAVGVPEVVPIRIWANAYPSEPRRYATRGLPTTRRAWNSKFRLGWLMGAGAVVLLVAIALIGGKTEPPRPASSPRQAAVYAGFEVTADVLNVRKTPAGQSSVIGQILAGTTVVPTHVSGNWYGIDMADGSIGWVHNGFLKPAGK